MRYACNFFFRFGIRKVRVSAEERNERDGMYRQSRSDKQGGAVSETIS